jgi:hypothetical protein
MVERGETIRESTELKLTGRGFEVVGAEFPVAGEKTREVLRAASRHSG